MLAVGEQDVHHITPRLHTSCRYVKALAERQAQSGRIAQDFAETVSL